MRPKAWNVAHVAAQDVEAGQHVHAAQSGTIFSAVPAMRWIPPTIHPHRDHHDDAVQVGVCVEDRHLLLEHAEDWFTWKVLPCRGSRPRRGWRTSRRAPCPGSHPLFREALLRYSIVRRARGRRDASPGAARGCTPRTEDMPSRPAAMSQKTAPGPPTATARPRRRCSRAPRWPRAPRRAPEVTDLALVIRIVELAAGDLDGVPEGPEVDEAHAQGEEHRPQQQPQGHEGTRRRRPPPRTRPLASPRAPRAPERWARWPRSAPAPAAASSAPPRHWGPKQAQVLELLAGGGLEGRERRLRRGHVRPGPGRHGHVRTRHGEEQDRSSTCTTRPAPSSMARTKTGVPRPRPSRPRGWRPRHGGQLQRHRGSG